MGAQILFTSALAARLCQEPCFDAWLLRMSKARLTVVVLQVGASDAGQHILAAVPRGAQQHQRRRAGGSDVSDSTGQGGPHAVCMMHRTQSSWTSLMHSAHCDACIHYGSAAAAAGQAACRLRRSMKAPAQCCLVLRTALLSCVTSPAGQRGEDSSGRGSDRRLCCGARSCPGACPAKQAPR